MVLFNLYDDWLKSIPSYTVRSIIIIMIMRSLNLSNYLVHVYKIIYIFIFTILFLLGIFQINPHPKSSSREH